MHNVSTNQSADIRNFNNKVKKLVICTFVLEIFYFSRIFAWNKRWNKTGSRLFSKRGDSWKFNMLQKSLESNLHRPDFNELTFQFIKLLCCGDKFVWCSYDDRHCISKHSSEVTTKGNKF